MAVKKVANYTDCSRQPIEDYPAASCSPASGGIPRKEFNQSIIRSLTPQQAAGNALAIAVQFCS
jgi:hypothetical protein